MGASASISAFRTNEEIHDYFIVVDSAGANVTSIAPGAFGTQLATNNASSAQTVTINEVAGVALPGMYRVRFTPNAAGLWALRVTHSTYDTGGWKASWLVFASDLGDLDYIAQTAIPASNTADTILDKVNFLEERAGEGFRVTPTYDGSNRMSSSTLLYSQDAFATTHRTRTVTFTYGDSANPNRPTRIEWTA